MKTYFFLIVLLVSKITLSQKLPNIRDDKQCLDFIHNNLKEEDFIFDTTFNNRFDKYLPNHLKYKKWQIIDFNNDKLPDLVFVGKYKKSITRTQVAKVFLSSPKKEKPTLLSLMRNLESPHFCPLIKSIKKGYKTYLCIYLLDDGTFNKWDTIIQKEKNKYPSVIKWADTLQYFQGLVINFNKSPTKILFDSIEYKYSAGMMGESFKIKCGNDGKVLANYPYSTNIQNEKIIYFDIVKLNRLKELIASIDVNTIRRDFSIGATDLNSATFTIFYKKDVHILNDYGLQSNFTLKEIYEIFSELIWQNFNDTL